MERHRSPPPRCVALAAALLIGLGALTAGCGQKGPLYLPKKTKTVIRPAAPAAPAPPPGASTDGSPAPPAPPAASPAASPASAPRTAP